MAAEGYGKLRNERREKTRTWRASIFVMDGYGPLFGGEGGIRTHVGRLSPHPISSRRRCDRFGTSPGGITWSKRERALYFTLSQDFANPHGVFLVFDI
jgi:hypothetical protein